MNYEVVVVLLDNTVHVLPAGPVSKEQAIEAMKELFEIDYIQLDASGTSFAPTSQIKLINISGTI